MSCDAVSLPCFHINTMDMASDKLRQTISAHFQRWSVGIEPCISALFLLCIWSAIQSPPVIPVLALCSSSIYSAPAFHTWHLRLRFFFFFASISLFHQTLVFQSSCSFELLPACLCPFGLLVLTCGLYLIKLFCMWVVLLSPHPVTEPSHWNVWPSLENLTSCFWYLKTCTPCSFW